MTRPKFILYSILTLITHSSCEQTKKLKVFCNYHEIKFEPTLDEIFACNLTKQVVIKERYLKEIEADGWPHTTEYANKKVRAIHAYFKSINYIPDFSAVFPSGLNAIHLDMCKVLRLTKDEIKPYPKLQHLNLHRNKLRVLEKDLFVHNPDLVYVRVSSNMLREIDPHIFGSLRALKFVILRGNECTLMEATDAEALAGLARHFQVICVTEYRPAPVSRKREEWKRIAKDRTSIWRTFGAFGAVIVAIGVFRLVKMVVVR